MVIEEWAKAASFSRPRVSRIPRLLAMAQPPREKSERDDEIDRPGDRESFVH
jgi:hypothetical protein